jgi:hypothetical protein
MAVNNEPNVFGVKPSFNSDSDVEGVAKSYRQNAFSSSSVRVSVGSTGWESGCLKWVSEVVSLFWNWLKSLLCGCCCRPAVEFEPCTHATGKRVQGLIAECFEGGKLATSQQFLEKNKSYEALIAFTKPIRAQHSFSIHEGKVLSLAPFLDSIENTGKISDFCEGEVTFAFVEKVAADRWRVEVAEYKWFPAPGVGGIPYHETHNYLHSSIYTKEQALKAFKIQQLPEKEFLRKAGLLDPTVEEPSKKETPAEQHGKDQGSTPSAPIDFPSKTPHDPRRPVILDAD